MATLTPPAQARFIRKKIEAKPGKWQLIMIPRKLIHTLFRTVAGGISPTQYWS